MSLRITLRPGERVVVNGAVLTSVGRTEFRLDGPADLLRGRDVMQPEDAVTPASRLYFACMMAYIDQRGRAAHQDLAVGLLADLLGVLAAAEARAACLRIAGHLARGDLYKALGECRTLRAYEAEALARRQDQG